MKAGIHPTYVPAQVACACGHAFETRSTRPSIRVEICSACHPFFTGRQKLIDTAGRVERFKKRFAKTDGLTVARKPKAAVKRVEFVAARKKVLSTAPKKEPKAVKKKA